MSSIQSTVKRALFSLGIWRKLAGQFDNRYFVDDKSVIGFNTFLGPGCRVTKAKIGNYCSLASGVLVGMGEHPIHNVSTSACFIENPYEEFTRDDITIGSDVWIGANAVVLRGVHIGHGAVVGANAVVTKDVPAYAVVAGVPARLIKFRFDQSEVEMLLFSRWWERPLDEAVVEVGRLKVELDKLKKPSAI